MKNFTLLLFAAIIAVVSCKDKGDAPGPDNPGGPDIEPPLATESNTLPKKILLDNGERSENYTITYKPGSKYSYEFLDSKNPKFPTKITGTKKEGDKPEVNFEATIVYK